MRIRAGGTNMKSKLKEFIKEFIHKYGPLPILLIMLVAYFGPNPILRKVNDSEVGTILYRADTCEALHYFYPSEAVPSVDEEEILRILHKSKRIVTPAALSGVPIEAITLSVSFLDGDVTKSVTLGDWNQVTVFEGSGKVYHILNSASVLKQLLDCLHIDENTDTSQFPSLGGCNCEE